MNTVALGELIRPAKVARAGGGDYPLLSMTMHAGLVDQAAKFKKRVASEDVSGYKVIRRGQLVVGFPIDEGVLDFQTRYDAGIVSPAYGVWDVCDEARVHAPYLKKFLRSGQAMAYYKGKLRGSTARRRSLPREVFLALSVPLPGIEQQRRIAAILDHADALRAKRRQVLAHLDALEDSIFLSMFGHDRDLRPISELCDLIVDCVNRTAPIVDEVTPFKMLRTTNVRNGSVDTQKVRYATEEVFTRWNRRATPQRGDVLLTREAPLGEAGVLLSDEQVFLGQRLMLYRANPEVLTPEYLVACFRSPILRSQFERLGSGSTVKHLPLPACRGFDIPVAPIEEQRRYSARVAAINEMRGTVRSTSAEEDLLFSSLQSRAFRGEL